MSITDYLLPIQILEFAAKVLCPILFFLNSVDYENLIISIIANEKISHVYEI